jgi:hypothetical protein
VAAAAATAAVAVVVLAVAWHCRIVTDLCSQMAANRGGCCICSVGSIVLRPWLLGAEKQRHDHILQHQPRLRYQACRGVQLFSICLAVCLLRQQGGRSGQGTCMVKNL